MSGLRRVDLAQRCLLAITGDDRRDFLQGLITADLRLLSARRALWGALLTPQGKYLFDFFLLEPDDGRFLLEADARRAPALVRRLSMYRLRARVDIGEPDEESRVIAIMGEEAPARFGLPPEPGAARPLDGGVLFVDPRHPGMGLRLVLPGGAALPDAIAALEEGGTELYEERRLSLGIPETADLLPEKSLPLEYNFAELGGVSFDKGCYIGQEVTARMKHRGRLRKRLLPAEVEGAAASGEPVLAPDGREAGELRSVHGCRALALLRLDHLGQDLRAGEATIRPSWPAWLKEKE